MTGKIYIVAENFYDNLDDLEEKVLIDYKEYSFPYRKGNLKKGWFFSTSSCEEHINTEYMRLVSYLNESELECVDICFCKLYRLRVLRAIFKGRFKRSFKYFVAGLKRMNRNYTEKKNGM